MLEVLCKVIISNMTIYSEEVAWTRDGFFIKTQMQMTLEMV